MQAKPVSASPSPKANSEILEIAPYVQGKSGLPEISDPIKLSSNESSFGPCPAAREAYNKAAEQLHRYPDGSQDALRRSIAGVLDLNAERIICGNGSDELLDLIYRSYLSKGDEVVLSRNHFVMCALYAKIQGANVVFADENNFRTDIDDLLARVSDKTKIVTLANPNNPTGTYLRDSEIRAIHAGLPSNVLLIIDGAYAEYVVQDDFTDSTALVEEFENVIVTRTFSKIYGLSALRIGWAYCPPAVIDVLQRIRSPFNTNSPAMAAAEAAVKDQAYIEKIRVHTAEWMLKIARELEGAGISVVPSSTNFYLLVFTGCTDRSAPEAAAFLEARGIIPRAVASTESDDYLRITVGLEHENTAVIEALKAYMAG